MGNSRQFVFFFFTAAPSKVPPPLLLVHPYGRHGVAAFFFTNSVYVYVLLTSNYDKNNN